MTDNKTVKQRSENMAAIHSVDTKPEIYVRKLLFSKGFRYRLYPKNIPGHPDIWLKKYNTAIFINGCFWHRHLQCKYAYNPKSRIEFWKNKFAQNINRDKEVRRMLREKNIRCFIIWECTINAAKKKNGDPESLAAGVIAFLNSDEMYGEM